MGHQRMGTLPRTRQWKGVMELITGGADAAEIAASTAAAAEQSLADAGKNTTLTHAFWLLTQVPLAAKATDFGNNLRELGLEVTNAPDLIEIAAAMLEAIDQASITGNHRRNDLARWSAKRRRKV